MLYVTVLTATFFYLYSTAAMNSGTTHRRGTRRPKARAQARPTRSRTTRARASGPPGTTSPRRPTSTSPTPRRQVLVHIVSSALFIFPLSEYVLITSPLNPFKVKSRHELHEKR